MRDIGARIKRYRLSRYAPPEDPWRRRIRWLPLLLGAWVLWAGLISEHSFLRLWQVKHDVQAKHAALTEAEDEIERLGSDLDDPKAMRDIAERQLRINYMMVRPDEIIYSYEDNLADTLSH